MFQKPSAENTNEKLKKKHIKMRYEIKFEINETTDQRVNFHRKQQRMKLAIVKRTLR